MLRDSVADYFDSKLRVQSNDMPEQALGQLGPLS